MEVIYDSSVSDYVSGVKTKCGGGGDIKPGNWQRRPTVGFQQQEKMVSRATLSQLNSVN